MGFSSLRNKSISCLYNNFSYLSFLRTVIMTITLIHYSLTIYYFEYPMLTYLYTTHCKIFVGRSAFVWNTKNHFALLRCVGIKLKRNYLQYMKAFDNGKDFMKTGVFFEIFRPRFGTWKYIKISLFSIVLKYMNLCAQVKIFHST